MSLSREDLFVACLPLQTHYTMTASFNLGLPAKAATSAYSKRLFLAVAQHGKHSNCCYKGEAPTYRQCTASILAQYHL